MKNFFALLMVLGSAIYMDTDSGDFFIAFILPILLIIGLAVLFWLRGFIAIVILTIAVSNSNLESTLNSEGVFWPIVAVISGIYLLYWMGKKATEQRLISYRASGGNSSGSYYFGDSGSSGCDSGGGGCDGGGGC